MRLSSVLCIVLLVLSSAASRADGARTEPHAMLYYEVALDGGAHQEDAGFGFRLDRVDRNRSSGLRIINLRISHTPPMFDFKAGLNGVERFTIAGTDYRRLLYVNKADEGKDAGEEKSAPAPAKKENGKLTISKLLDEAPTGWIIGGVIGVVLITGATD